MIIELSNNVQVEIKEKLNFGEYEDIQKAMGDTKVSSDGKTEFSLDQMRAMQYKALEIAVVKITDGEKEIKYSKDFVRGLSVEDATLVLDSATKLLSTSKK